MPRNTPKKAAPKKSRPDDDFPPLEHAAGIAIHCAHTRLVDVTELVPNPRNPNKHPDQQVALLAKIIRHQGWRSPIVVSNRSGFIVKGHGRLQAAALLQVQTVPVDFQDYENEAAEWADLLADNRISELSENDADTLAEILGELSETDLDLDLTGFDGTSIADILDTNEEPGNGGQDATPETARADELARHWGVKPGQVWALGPHRLAVGSCGDTDLVERLCAGDGNFDAVLSDPPYGTNQPGVPHDSPEELADILAGMIRVAAPRVVDAAAVFFQSPRTFPALLAIVTRDSELRFERLLWIYKQAQCTFPWRGWLLTSEAILVFSVGKPHWNEVSPYAHDCYMVAEVSGELAEGSGWHGSVKPLKVVSDLLSRISKPGDLIYEPFSGSGTTIIACQNTGRVCRAVEVAPPYVAVALQRFMDATGIRPVLTGAPASTVHLLTA